MVNPADMSDERYAQQRGSVLARELPELRRPEAEAIAWSELGFSRAVGGSHTQTAWGERRGVTQQSVGDNVSSAREQIVDELPEPVTTHPDAMGTIEDALGD